MATDPPTMESYDVTSAVSLAEREGGDFLDDMLDSMVCGLRKSFYPYYISSMNISTHQVHEGGILGKGFTFQKKGSKLYCEPLATNNCTCIAGIHLC